MRITWNYVLLLTVTDLCDNRFGDHGGVRSRLAGNGVGNHAGDSAGLDGHLHVVASGSLDLSITDLRFCISLVVYASCDESSLKQLCDSFCQLV